VVKALQAAVKLCNQDMKLKTYISIALQLTIISGSFLDPLKPVKNHKSCPAPVAVAKLIKDVSQCSFKVQDVEFAARVFQKDMVSAIPHTVNSK